MSVFAGGSAYNMVRDIADGYILVSERTFKGYSRKDLNDFVMEADRLLRDVRAAQAPLSDTVLTQKRQRRMQRLMQAMTMANAAAVRRA
jgi:LPS O-antigen subunit length determinant protein (WzzB/FepE family)